ncbi:TPA: antirestriction protein ArdA [Pseudomonas aeruginosa]|uniref:antirestriction protein ArdA n=1 Tax=Pseudomonas aeruginosa TaxID=287 RepID=UPI00193CF6AA|nr:antirestriction protein ArdA [Pseudomonas aeruginosa]MBI8227661.1 antirestriction protein ArdA [Pseudomonas aeruginosa]MDP5708050.1 antirestriction protein ArdA [Pseudomonas aeruginosa]HBO0349232.1 antirestriction protein ArdA [Pseudomonas aeruginosa]HCF2190762.1 antirestriction protein ArdA [Pseudomonas aeruginosa]HCW0997214.1 antirestriction protein ArdA [Pseudomonas aeruginosa]
MSKAIRIYVADLAAYNAGHLHGIWIDATLDIDDIQAKVDAMLAASPVEGAEEYAIHDFEGFDGYRLGEYEALQDAHEIACFIEEFPDFGGALLSQFNDLKQARKAAEEDYCGCYTSLADYAQELTEQTTSIPQHLAHYIDYRAMARDMEIGGDLFTLETGFEQVHVFWNR